MFIFFNEFNRYKMRIESHVVEIYWPNSRSYELQIKCYFLEDKFIILDKFFDINKTCKIFYREFSIINWLKVIEYTKKWVYFGQKDSKQ